MGKQTKHCQWRHIETWSVSKKEKQERFIDVAILIATNSELSFNRIPKETELRMLSIHALFLQLLFVKTDIKYSMCLESHFVFVISNNFSFILKTVLDF